MEAVIGKPEQPKDHYHMDGQVVDFYDNFTDPRSGEQIEYPLAPGGSAAMVINCRCSYIVVPKRTAEEQANTFAEPFFWSQGETIPAHDATYMVQSDPFGEVHP